MSYKNSIPYFPSEDIDQIISEVKEILSGNGFLTKGPKVKEFEKAYAAYTGTRYAIATNSCTTALEIVLKAIGIRPDDEVVVPVQTFIATGSSVVSAGGKLIFCDCNENFSIDFESLKSVITSKTKAVIVVHFAGLIQSDIFEIKNYLSERNIYLIEDCAHSNGAFAGGKCSGSIGDFGCHSFYSTKVMTTGEGGMITTDNEKLQLVCSSLRSIGLDVASGKEVFNRVGTNNRMAEFEAILGLSQLKRLDEFVIYRNHIAAIYRRELRSLEEDGIIRFQHAYNDSRHAYWKFLIFLSSDKISRESLRNALLSSGVGMDAPYQPLMHLQPVFREKYGIVEGMYPKVEALSQTHFCLPMHIQISEADAIQIAGMLKNEIEK